MEVLLAADRTKVKNELEASHNQLLQQVEFLGKLRDEWGDRYPEAAFLPPLKGDEATRERVWTAMRELWGFWKRVKTAYEEGVLDDKFFSRHWAGRGREYRLLVEPVDIANYYRKNKHLESGHYADGVGEDELTDNDRRPGRYILLQRQEARAFGEGRPSYVVESSLGKARQFKEQFGEKKWEECIVATEPAPAPLPEMDEPDGIAGSDEVQPAWPWFKGMFDSPDNRDLYSEGVPWKHFWHELAKLISRPSVSFNNVCAAYVDNELYIAEQRQVFQDHLAGRVKLAQLKEGLSKEEFHKAVKTFGGAAGLRAGLDDLIEAVMKDEEGAKYEPGDGLRDQAFLSHTGADRPIGSVPIVQALYTELQERRRVPAFYDTHSIEPGAAWRDKIDRCARGSRVFVAVLSPMYFERYWCMHELEAAVLDAAANGEKRVIFPVLLGVGLDLDKQAAGFRSKWEAFSQVSQLPPAERAEKLDRWEAAVTKVSRNMQAVKASNSGFTGDEHYPKGNELAVAKKVADLVCERIAGLY